MADVAILVPTLGRPQSLGPLLDSLEAATPENVYRVVFVIDSNDAASFREITRLNRPYVRVLVENGTYPHKINAAALTTEEPWVFLTADDVRFHPGWWEATEEARNTENVGVIGTNDLHNRHVAAGKYATQFLVARWYVNLGTIDGPGVFHEGYHHNCVDIELSETAMSRGMFAWCMDSHVEHLHHHHGNREVDETDRKGNLHGREEDRALLRERRKLWQAF